MGRVSLCAMEAQMFEAEAALSDLPVVRTKAQRLVAARRAYQNRSANMDQVQLLHPPALEELRQQWGAGVPLEFAMRRAGMVPVRHLWSAFTYHPEEQLPDDYPSRLKSMVMRSRLIASAADAETRIQPARGLGSGGDVVCRVRG